MHYLIAAIYLMFALAGFDGWGARTIATHVSDHGTEVLYSEASISPILARFSCIDSVSGLCHFRILPGLCLRSAGASSLPGCSTEAVREFVVARGDSRQMTDMKDDFDFCVSADSLPAGAPCKPEVRAGASAPGQ
jgi:hypothetical protein